MHDPLLIPTPDQQRTFNHLQSIVAELYPTLTARQTRVMAAWMLELYKAPPPNRRAFVEALWARRDREEALGSLTPDLFEHLIQLARLLNLTEPDVREN
jgi:hypothetical protein